MTIRLIFILFCLFNTAIAQDFNYSQLSKSQALVNPALINRNVNDYEIQIHRRSQWYTVTRPFNTIVFSYTQKQALKNTSLGLNIINDIAGDSRFSTDGLYLALANNIKINEDNLSLGIQGSMFQKSLNYDELFFLEEESFYNNTISFFDMNIGAAFMTSNFIASASIYHLNKPNQTFFKHESRKTRT